MQTAVSWLEQEFIKLESTIGVHGKMYELIEQAKEMEKQQIIDAYYGYELYLDREFRFQQGGQAKILTFDQWYETYGSKGSDVTSSQTEISDEEIEKGAKEWYEKKGLLRPYQIEKMAWISAIKWYREQLKTKQ